MTTRYTLWQRVRSLRHAAAVTLSERVGRVRRSAPEVAAGVLPPLAAAAGARIDELVRRYGVRFEQSQEAPGALQAYEYLDLLDQALGAWGRAAPYAGVVHDVGSASFSYVAALAALLRPTHLVGVELEGYRRLRGGYNRAERALANVARVPGASFVVGDYAKFEQRADLITAFFPFVTPAPVLGWRMPLSVLRPAALFERIAGNLHGEGSLWMVNHSEEEAAIAAGYAMRAGLCQTGRHVAHNLLQPRPAPPVVSAWRPATTASAPGSQ